MAFLFNEGSKSKLFSYAEKQGTFLLSQNIILYRLATTSELESIDIILIILKIALILQYEFSKAFGKKRITGNLGKFPLLIIDEKKEQS